MKRLRALIVRAVAAALSVPISVNEGFIAKRNGGRKKKETVADNPAGKDESKKE